ncbi:hypothetical protein RND81_05G242400 [Saponaria officinalis]|uniref:Uncharacterized protein n=1 Tax=Saponaria officinalis TaxID=3572 RepID=A0AAW1L1W7_SAPOF
MANKAGNKLTKLRSALKKINSFSKTRRENNINTNTNNTMPTSSSDQCGLHTVYVGKSLRPYHVSQQVLDHPAIQELVGKSTSEGCEEIIVVGCEVVLFEHLLWMLHNSDAHSEPLNDLVHFYAY